MQTATATVPPGPTRGDRRRWAALYVLCLGVLMIVLDATIVNVALPDIQDELGFTQSSLAWVVNGYLIAFGGLLLLAGRLGDLIGTRTVYLTGLVVFTGASLACGVSTSQAMLVSARFLQGAGGALTSAVILGMLVGLFPEPREQAKAFGVYAFVASGGGAVGLILGGILTEAVNWHWIFFVNVPIGIATFVMSLRLIAPTPGVGLRQGADYVGAALVTSALMLGVFTIVKPAAERGWGDALTLGLGAGAVALLAGFVVRQARAARPLMPLRVFRSKALVGANLLQVLGAAAMFSVFFMGSLYLERVLGYGPLQIGLAYLPMTVMMALLSVRYSARISARIGARSAQLLGTVLMLLSVALLTRLPADAVYARDILPAMLLLGVGAGTGFPALMGLAMADVEPADAGLASGLVNTTAQVGGALGLAVLATLATGRTEAALGSGGSPAAALVAGTHVAFSGALLLFVGSVVVTMVLLRPEGMRLPSALLERLRAGGLGSERQVECLDEVG
jgi:EmrB/QacA subfamily drug resistance transporter